MYFIEDDKFYINRGDDGVINVELLLGGKPIEIPGRLTLAVRERPLPDSPVLLQVSSETARILLPHDLTGRIPAGRYSADLQLDMPDGRRATLWPRLSGSRRYTASNYRNFIVMPEVVQDV